jgi:ubiquinone/menaquinone biosynthesis C-methylase UbiE
MDARLQRRVQRYGWDLAAADYAPLWQAQLALVQAELLRHAALKPGERVLDVACGTGLVSIAAARAVGVSGGGVDGVDLSGEMIERARHEALQQGCPGTAFTRMDAEALAFEAARFDVALCSLGLMYLPDPPRAMREMGRVLRPGGRLVLAVWGERTRCRWATLFNIVQDEVASEVCPLFFQFGQPDALAASCRTLGFLNIHQHRITTTLDYADAAQACRAAFSGGPVALAWSRFDDETRARVCARYTESIEPWRHDAGYRIPAEFVIVSAAASG